MIKKFKTWWTKCRHRKYAAHTGWYYGTFAEPVYGRSERHCLCCGRREYSIYGSDGVQHWIAFKFPQ